MSLLMVETPEQALLSTVIDEAYKVARQSDSYVGRTKVQKLLYFLKARGVPMSYKFDIYHYGPYADSLQRDMDWLLADEVIVDESNDTSKYSSYAPGPAISEALLLHPDRIEPYRTVILAVVSAFAPLRPDELELTATLDYTYRKLRGIGVLAPDKDRVINAFIEIKKDKFTKEQVEDTYAKMAMAGVFSN